MSTSQPPVVLAQARAPENIDPGLREALTHCWAAVSDAGGAVGFPFPPVDRAEVAKAVDSLVSSLAPDRSRLFVARIEGRLAGWVHLDRRADPLVAHWGTVRRLQTHPQFRGRGVGSTLMRRLHQVAGQEMGLRHLHLAARGGVGLEPFYARLGWREIGRWPGALRLAPGDDREEILMFLDLT
jgi:GNAT superfamily N-acetyltransferase